MAEHSFSNCLSYCEQRDSPLGFPDCRSEVQAASEPEQKAEAMAAAAAATAGRRQ